MKIRYINLLLISILFFVSCSDDETGHFIIDEHFVLLKDSVSPNGEYKYLTYQYDTGAFGYSRVFWSVIRVGDEGKDILREKIPDGYKIKGWTENNELELIKWEPYYYKDDYVDLKTGSEFKGIKLIVKVSLTDKQWDEARKERNDSIMFIRDLPFDILTVNKSNDYPSSETDTSYCTDWILTKQEIEKIIKECEPISGYEWGQLFEHWPCLYTGNIEQNELYYDYELNAGGWMVIFEADTNYWLGNFKKENEKCFLSSAWDIEE